MLLGMRRDAFLFCFFFFAGTRSCALAGLENRGDGDFPSLLCLFGSTFFCFFFCHSLRRRGCERAPTSLIHHRSTPARRCLSLAFSISHTFHQFAFWELRELVRCGEEECDDKAKERTTRTSERASNRKKKKKSQTTKLW